LHFIECCALLTLARTHGTVQATDRTTGLAYNANLSDYTAPFSSVVYTVVDSFCGITAEDANVGKAALVINRSATLTNGKALPDEPFVYVFTVNADAKITAIEMFGDSVFSISGYTKAQLVLADMSSNETAFESAINASATAKSVFIPAGGPPLANATKAGPQAQNVTSYTQTVTEIVSLLNYAAAPAAGASRSSRSLARVSSAFKTTGNASVNVSTDAFIELQTTQSAAGVVRTRARARALTFNARTPHGPRTRTRMHACR
jgi:hypothetical protein